MAKEELRTRQDAVGTTFGVIVFFLGIALLALVFYSAWRMFSDTGLITAMATAPPGAGAAKGGGGGITAALIGVAIKLVALFVMSLAGSLTASKGIHLYLASR